MAVVRLTTQDFDESSSHRRYVGATDVGTIEGDLVLEEHLGHVWFTDLAVTGSILALSGTSIHADRAITAGGSITAESIGAHFLLQAGGDIEALASVHSMASAIRAGGGIRAVRGEMTADTDIEAGGDIVVGERIDAGLSIAAIGSIDAGEWIQAGWGLTSAQAITAGCGITAGHEIHAGRDLRAGHGIEAGRHIEAVHDIAAGWGVRAGYSITCGAVLAFRYRLFAGVAVELGLDDHARSVTCGRLAGGTVGYGDVNELWHADSEPI